jgi:hypothetical protein
LLPAFAIVVVACSPVLPAPSPSGPVPAASQMPTSSPAADPSPELTPRPPATPQPFITAIELLTYDAPPQRPGSCNKDLGGGYLQRDGRTGLGVQPVDDRRVPQLHVKWPYGYAAYLDGGIPNQPDTKAVLVDATGRTVARQGDVVAFVGDFGPDNTFFICNGTGVVLVYDQYPDT